MTIYDDRECFYQWDVDQKITSDTFKVGDTIHFANKDQIEALPVKAYMLDGQVVADVPNILLEASLPLKVWKYEYSEHSAQTTEEHVFDVKKRAKPSDHVYTETELYELRRTAEEATAKALRTEAEVASAENERQIDELDREFNETERITAEVARVTAENERLTAETTRLSAESARIVAEQERQSAETVRQTAFEQSYNNIANALKGTVSGDVIRVDDVSPIEHTVKAKVNSKNLYDITSATVNSSGKYAVSGEHLEYGETYTITSDLPMGWFKIAGHRITGYGCVQHSDYVKGGFTSYTFTLTRNENLEEDAPLLICVDNYEQTAMTNLELLTAMNIRVTKGTSPTEHTPYIDPTTVTVTRCGKNLIPFPYPLLLNGKTQSGLTITPQDDGGIVIDGTATADAYINLASFKLCSKSIYPWSTHGMISNSIKNHSIRCVYDSSNHLIFILVQNGTVCENVKFYPQIEVGTAMSDFEKGNPKETHTPEADGTVNITSLPPTMTLLTNIEGVTIEAEYNRDINIVINDIIKSITELKG